MVIVAEGSHSIDSLAGNGCSFVRVGVALTEVFFRDVDVFLFLVFLLDPLLTWSSVGGDDLLALLGVTSDPVPANIALVSVEPSLALESSENRS